MIRFGPFEFDPHSGDLRQGEQTQRLAPQSAQVLALLLERRGQVVSRAEFRARIWPDTTVEFDQGLSFCVRQLRIALDDDADQPKYIETLPRRGYRFVASIEAPAISAEPVVRSIRAERPRRNRIAIGTVVLVLVLVSAAAVVVRQTGTRAPLLAIVPFDADSALPVLVAYRDRLAEELVVRATDATLGRVGVLGPATTSGFHSRSSPDSVRARTGAAYVLSGAVRRRGDSVEVFAQLIRTSDRAHIWVTRKVDSGATDSARLLIGNRIADSVVNVLLHPELPRKPLH